MLRAGAGRYVTNVYIVRVHCDRLHRRPCSSRRRRRGKRKMSKRRSKGKRKRSRRSCLPCSCATRCPAAASRQTLHCTHHRNAEQQYGITCAATHLLLETHGAGAAPGGGPARAAVNHALPPPVGGAHVYIYSQQLFARDRIA